MRKLQGSLIAYSSIVWLFTVHAAADQLGEDHNRAWQLVGQRRPDDAIPILAAMLERDPTYWRAYKTLRDAYSQKKNLDQAERFFRQLLSRTPYAHYGLGLVYRATSRTDLALEAYTACARKGLRVPECYIELVNMLMDVTKRNASNRDLRMRLPGGPEHPYACLAFVSSLQWRRKVVEARSSAQSCLNTALTSDEDWLIEAHFLLLSSYGTEIADRRTLSEQQPGLAISVRRNDWENVWRFRSYIGASLVQIDPDRALPFLEESLIWSRKLDHRGAIADTLWSLSALQQSAGDWDRSLRNAWEAYRYWMEDDEHRAALALRDIGGIAHRRGDLPAAIEYYKKSLEMVRALRAHTAEAYVLRAMGVAYLDAGDYLRAIAYGEDSIRIFRRFGMGWQAGAGLGNIGIAFSLMGDYASALRFTEESRRSALKHQDPGEVQRNLLVLGDLYLRMGDPKGAKRKFDQALAMVEWVKHVPFKVEGLLGIGLSHQRLGEFQPALLRLNESLRAARSADLRASEASALLELAHCWLRLDNLDRAETLYQESLDISQLPGFPEPIVAARRGLAEIARRRDDISRAMNHLQLAIERIETVRGRIPTPDLKTGFARENAKIYEDAIDVRGSMHARAPGVGHDLEAFGLAERGRARTFLDLLADSKAQATKTLTPQQIREQSILAKALSGAMAALLHSETQENRRAVELAERRLAEWTAFVSSSNPRFNALHSPAPFDARQAQRLAAAAGAAILEYALGERQSWLWTVTGTQVRMVSLPRRGTIESTVRAYRKTLELPPNDATRDAWREPSNRLYRMLIEPAISQLTGQRKLIIAPDGILYYLPFETLAIGKRLLVEDFEITHAPSVSVYAALGRSPRSPGNALELLAYGDPPFSRSRRPEQSSSAAVQTVYSAGGLRFSPLPNTRLEVNAVGNLFPEGRRVLRLGLEASEASLKQENLFAFRRIHFATHAVVDERAPARSGIVMSLNDSGEEDGVLRVGEILNLDGNAELVVLSACRTALGQTVRGEGMLGLTRAFLSAVAPRVVVSLWDVNDVATLGFMKSFYAKIAGGVSPASAMQEVKSRSSRYQHPYFWAPFVSFGVF